MTTAADDSPVELRQYLAAAPERVFAAFSEARLVAKWLRPSPEVRLTVLQHDFRPGGTYRFAYDPPGQHTVVIGGIYRMIEPPSKIVFSWIIEAPDEHAGIDSEVTVTIMPRGSGAELVVHHARLTRQDARTRHAEGWRGAIAQLGSLLETGWHAR